MLSSFQRTHELYIYFFKFRLLDNDLLISEISKDIADEPRRNSVKSMLHELPSLAVKRPNYMHVSSSGSFDGKNVRNVYLHTYTFTNYTLQFCESRVYDLDIIRGEIGSTVFKSINGCINPN